MVDLTLVLFSGLPGTGKTSLAIELSRRLQIPLFAKDRFQSQLRLLGLTEREGAAGYELLFDIADQQLALGIGVILDAVFPMQGFRQRAETLAERHTAAFKTIFCYFIDDTLHRARLEHRQQYVPHWTPVGWDEVERIRATFELWSPEAALHLDAAANFESNLSRALSYIQENEPS